MTPRLPLAAALALAVAAALTWGAPATSAAPDAQRGDRFVHTVAPRPGALAESGPAALRARLASSEPITAVEVRLDGAVVPDAVVEPGGEGGAVVRAPVALTVGTRTAAVRFSDEAGVTTERSWSFTVTDRAVRRLAGPNRIATAVALSTDAFPDGGAQAAVLARADDFADALAGVPLAAHVGGPLLLTASSELSDATAAELRRVLPPGAPVHLLGGRAALAADVRNAVDALGHEPVRHGGADRFATAAAVARRLPPASGAFLVTGAAFPDALAASAPAGRDGTPVLLTAPDRLPDATAAALEELGPQRVTIVGGGTAVGRAVADAAAESGATVDRIAGADRYATAAAIAEAFYGAPAAATLASGTTFPDALAGARHAAGTEQPVLLTRPARLPEPTEEALRAHRPGTLTVYGGTAAVGEATVRAAWRAAEDGPDAPRVTRTAPATGITVAGFDGVTVDFAQPIEGGGIYLEIGGVEVRGTTERVGDSSLGFRPLPGEPPLALDAVHDVTATVRADNAGTPGHHEVAFTSFEPDPVFAIAGPVELHLPAREVELIGFHEANHRGAQQQEPRDTLTPKRTLPSRGRETGSRSAADVVAAPGGAVLAPVTGRVIRAGSYLLYCAYVDDFVVIEPDARPGWEVKVLHFHGLRVGVDDRVVADETVIGGGPRQLPFRSQVDRYTQPRDWPHLHVEVVDPSVPTPPGGSC